MISKQSLKSLLKSLKYSDEDIAKYIDTDDEHDVALPSGVKIYDEEGLNTLKENARKEGKVIGSEITIKNLKNKVGLDFEGKDEDDFISHFTESVKKQANVKPQEITQKYEAEKTEWQKKMSELQNQVQALQSEKEQIKTDKEFMANFPKGEKLLSDSDLLYLAKAKVQSRKEGDKTIYSYNGKDLQDDLMNPLGLSEALTQVFTAEKWIKEQPATPPASKGMGFNDSGKTGKTFKSITELDRHMQEKGLSPLTKEGREFVEAAIKENPELGKRA